MNRILLNRVNKAFLSVFPHIIKSACEEERLAGKAKIILKKKKYLEIVNDIFDDVQDLGKTSDLFKEYIDGIEYINIESRYKYLGNMDMPPYEKMDELFRIYTAHLIHSKLLLEHFIEKNIKSPDSVINYVMLCLSISERMNGYLKANYYEKQKRVNIARKAGSKAEDSQRIRGIIERSIDKHHITSGSQLRQNKLLRARFFQDVRGAQEAENRVDRSDKRILEIMNEILKAKANTK